MGKKRKRSTTTDETIFEQEVDENSIPIKEELADNELVELTPKSKKKKKKNKNKELAEELNVEEQEVENIEVPAEPEEDKIGAKDEDIQWESNDLNTLISNLEKQLPKNDTSKYSTTFEKVDWEKVKFGDHDAQECKDYALKVINKVRKYRTLTEMVGDAYTWIRNPYKSFSTGRIKHPDMPKKPMTPYLRFYTLKRSKYQAMHPDMQPSEMSKFLLSKYSALSEKKKLKYRRIYDQEMNEYREKMHQFKLDHPEVFKKVNPSRSSHEKNVGPDRPRTPFQFFTETKLKKYSDEDKKSAQEKIKELWSNLSEGKRIKFIRKSIQDQERYDAELAEYMKEHPNYEPPKFRSLLNKAEIELKYKFEGRPQKPPNSGYMLFSKLMLSEVKDVPSKEKMILIAKRWREMSDEERNEYNDMAQKDMNKYVAKFDAYLKQLPEEEKEKVLGENKLKLPNEKRLRMQTARVEEESNTLIDNTALMAFQMEELNKLQSKYPKKEKSELMEMINQKWKGFDVEQKQKYIQLAESIKDFMPKPKNVRASPAKEKLKKISDEMEFSKKTGIKRPPKNGFAFYCTQVISKRLDLPPRERMQYAANKWKQEVSQETKDMYNNMAKERLVKFNAQLSKYIMTGELPDPNQDDSLDNPTVNNGNDQRLNPKTPVKSKDAETNNPLDKTSSKSKEKLINKQNDSLSKVSKFLYQDSSGSDSD